MRKGPESRYFPALTGMRAVAASMVFFHHYNIFKPAWVGNFIHDCISEWHVGVTIFFVLSGFLICYRYHDHLFGEKGGLRNYFVNRFARIYPMYLIATLAAFLFANDRMPFSKTSNLFFLNITFLRGLFDEYKFTGAATGWSLTVEEMFYALFPLIILLSGRIRLYLQPLIFLGTGILLWLIFRDISFHGFFSNLTFLFEFTFFGRCFEFYTGIFLAYFLIRRANEAGSPPGGKAGSGFLRTLGGAAWICIGVGLLAMNRERYANSSLFLLNETLVNNFFLPPGIALLFYGLIVERSFVRKILETRLFSELGKSSYIFYLIHNGFLFPVFYYTLREKTELVFPLFWVVSFILYSLVEKPLNKWIRRKFSAAPPLRESPVQAG
jgi:peptidoglycan/LPS O-acetylase OafA/YrhL